METIVIIKLALAVATFWFVPLTVIKTYYREHIPWWLPLTAAVSLVGLLFVSGVL
jgi:hypothetical protein